MIFRLFYAVVNAIAVLFSTQVFSADIYMKSGNVVRLRFLKDLSVKVAGEDVKSISWETLTNTKPIHIDVSQIESIVQR